MEMSTKMPGLHDCIAKGRGDQRLGRIVGSEIPVAGLDRAKRSLESLHAVADLENRVACRLRKDRETGLAFLIAAKRRRDARRGLLEGRILGRQRDDRPGLFSCA